MTQASTNGTEANPRGAGRSGSVQSIERAFGLLETMADHGGLMGLSQLAAESGLPLPTIHRLVRTLVDLGYLRQEPSRQYVLGPKLIRLGESSSQMLSLWARPHLSRLVDELGESANLAMLDGDQIVYVAQAQSRHSMRMFTEVGRRVLPHCTAVGKAIMADMPREQVRDILTRTGMPKHTENTLTDPDEFAKQLAWSAEHGYAIDEGEQEVGVRCVAVSVPNVTSRLAISVSGPATRMTEDLVARAVPLLAQAGAALSEDLS
jgi:IclR family acetate operon transcriptional repressor